jgi:hypothetical protein
MVVVSMIVGLCVHTAAALPGSGTQQDPYRIQSLADFDEFAADPNYWSSFTRLETDVNLAGRTYSTAVIAPDVKNANYWFDGTAFTGVFDGNDHKLINLTIDDAGSGNDYLGLFGYIGEGEVRNLCLEGGSVSGDGLVGGLVGENYGGSVSNCYSTSDVNGFFHVGGLAGANGDYYHPGGEIANCYSTGNVSGENYVGGLVGINFGSISNCYSTSSTSGDGSVGGLVGANGYSWQHTGGAISNSYSIGDVSGTGWCVGGLVGDNEGTIFNCYSTSDVNGVSDVGGLVGLNCVFYCIGDECYFSPAYIYNSYSTGDVNGMDGVGGLVGRNTDGAISNCYSTGDVNGVSIVGGLVGQNGSFAGCISGPCPVSGYIYNSYSTSSLQGTSNIGGLVGYNELGGIEGSFWDVRTSGEPNMCGDQWLGTGCDPNCGKTTAQMKTKSTFTEAGWDFIEIWGIGENQTYPYLRTEPSGDSNHDGKVDLFDLAILASHWLEFIGPNQGGWRLVEDDTEDSYSCEGNFDAFYPCSNAVDEDWDTYALPADAGATSYVYENYIIPSGIEMADFGIKYQQTAPVTPGLCTSVTDYWDGSIWAELNCTALTGQISTLTVRIPNDALSRTTLQLRTRVWKSSGLIGSGSGMYYEGKVIWYFPVCRTIVVGGYK